MAGFERLYKDGQLAIVHGVGYDNPSFSHFTSMAYWQTGAPNSGDAYGWLGRLADTLDPSGGDNYHCRCRSAPVARGARARPRTARLLPARSFQPATPPTRKQAALDQLAGPRTRAQRRRGVPV